MKAYAFLLEELSEVPWVLKEFSDYWNSCVCVCVSDAEYGTQGLVHAGQSSTTKLHPAPQI